MFRNFEKDPNADLESFDNFDQDFTKSPDLHQNPPEMPQAPLPVSDKNYNYIPIGVPATTTVPYFETKRPLFTRPLRKNPNTDFSYIKSNPKHRIQRPKIPTKPSPPLPIPELPDYYSEYGKEVCDRAYEVKG